jgi:hypothetical protein
MTAWRKSIALAAAVAVFALAAVAVADPGGRGSRPPATGDTAAFAWLHPGVVPAGWTTRRLAGSPARLSAPPGWRPAAGDPGTRTMISRGPSGRIVGYLNATPRQGDERAANWSRFRPAHNREEGDRKVRLLAAAAGLRFRAATGACVIDSYATTTDNRFREIACIVSGRSATTVIVAAAPPSRWTAEAPILERAVSNFIT